VHDAIRLIEGSTVWSGESLAQQDWRHSLTTDAVHMIEDARAALGRAGRSATTVERNDLQATGLMQLATDVTRRLETGPGFVVLRGLNIARWPEDDAKMILWGLGCLIGNPRPQNLEGDRIHIVADVPVVSPGRTAPGGSTSNNEILPHTENARPPYPPRVIGLMCMRQARTGGESMLISGHELHNRVLARRADLMPRLYQDFQFGRHSETYPDGRISDFAPVFSSARQPIGVRYGRYWLNVAERTTGQPIDPVGREAVDLIDELLADTSMAVRFLLEPGDILIVDNETVLHARSSFTDEAEKGGGRRLLRLWLD
jgi:alpha-ketoglutarate-dependent taurine dioxygenase